MDLKIIMPYSCEFTDIREVVDFMSRPGTFTTTLEIVKHIVTIKMDFKFLVSSFSALQQFFFNVVRTCCCQQSRHPVQMRDDAIDNFTGRDLSRPANDCRNSETTFPGCCLFTVKRSSTTIRPGEDFGAVVGAPNNDSVFGNLQLIKKIK